VNTAMNLQKQKLEMGEDGLVQRGSQRAAGAVLVSSANSQSPNCSVFSNHPNVVSMWSQ
jgi:hypothetical protein